jgi:hypothetical protein
MHLGILELPPKVTLPSSLPHCLDLAFAAEIA